MKHTPFLFSVLSLLFCFSLLNASDPGDAKVREAAMAAGEIRPFASHTMLIFIDDTETDFGNISYDVLPALYQKSAYVLISTHLLKSVIGGKTFDELEAEYKQAQKIVEEFKPKLSEELPDIDMPLPSLNMEVEVVEEPTEYTAAKAVVNAYTENKYQEKKEYFDAINAILARIVPATPLNEQQRSEIIQKLAKELPKAPEFSFEDSRILMRSVLAFNYNEWVIKQLPSTNGALLLLIPKTYKPAMKPITQSTSELSSEELTAGLKVNHLPSVSKQELQELFNRAQKSELSNYFMQGIWDAPTQTSPLFVTRAEYTKANVSLGAMPQWAFFQTGHGLPEKRITGISPAMFGQWLAFIDTKIVTKLLYYWSCYAAGTNNELMSKDVRKGIGASYSFALIAGAAPDTVLYPRSKPNVSFEDFSIRDIDFSLKKLALEYHIDFNQFVSELTRQDTVDFLHLFNVLYPKTKIGGIMPGEMTEQAFLLRLLAHVKLPGLEWFKLLDSQEIVISLGGVLAVSRGSNNPLIIPDYFYKKGKKADLQIVLLYARSIPFPLRLNVEHVPLFASMLPGDSMHVLESISVSESVMLNDFLKKFERPPYPERRKIYWIKTIEISAIVAAQSPRELKTRERDIEYEKGKLNLKLLDLKFQEGHNEAQRQSLKNEIELLKNELAKIKEEIEKKSRDVRKMNLSNLIIDCKENTYQPTVFYMRENTPYKVTSYEAQYSGLQEERTDDYLKTYQQLADNDQALQREIALQQQFAGVAAVQQEKASMIKRPERAQESEPYRRYKQSLEMQRKQSEL